MVNAVQCYLGMWENLVDGNTKEFIITYGKQHKPALSDTISRWIKDEVGMTGINTNVYKPHSSRSASTSKARGNRVSITDIFKTKFLEKPEYLYKVLFQRYYK